MRAWVKSLRQLPAPVKGCEWVCVYIGANVTIRMQEGHGEEDICVDRETEREKDGKMRGDKRVERCDC